MIDIVNLKDKLELNELKTLPHGTLVTADVIANLSGYNRVKGIHPVYGADGNIEAVIILCTFDHGNYPNEWIDDEKLVLKYFLEGRENKKLGKKIFKENYKTNTAIIESAIYGYPIYVFTREKKGFPFQYEGEFYYQNVVEANEAKYFELIRVTEATIKYDKDFISEEMEFYTTNEGRKVLRQHYSRERDPRLIQLAKDRFIQKHGRLFCEVCGFDFVKVYGELGKGFIEGHHKVPISELSSSGEITRVEDIAILCSNCHRMIHRRKPWLAVDELRTKINKRTE